MKMNNVCYSLVFLALCLYSCGELQLKVASIGKPEYPIVARLGGIQGTVVVELEVGADGTVIQAKGSGANEVLVQAAKANATQWRFGPFPSKAQFPIYHKINYIFRLKGRPVFVATEPPDVRTELPSSIEISAPPIRPDNVAVPKPASKKGSQ